jgi:putative membrane protein
MVIPKWLSAHLKDDEIKAIEKQIEEIELKTQAEIVPVIVQSSSRYAQAQVTLILLFAMLFLILWEVLVPHLYWDYMLRAAGLLLAGLFIIFWGAAFLVRDGRVRRLLTLRAEELEQCWKRARIEFYENRLHHTNDSMGVLIYISILEHVVIVLADKKIADKLPPQTWQTAVDQVVLGIKSKKMASGIQKGLDACSHLLIENFPASVNNTNELSNKVVIKE